MYEFWIKDSGPRSPYQRYVSYLWGEDSDCDTDGNSSSPSDREWTELTIINRKNNTGRVDVDSEQNSPLIAVAPDSLIPEMGWFEFENQLSAFRL